MLSNTIHSLLWPAQLLEYYWYGASIKTFPDGSVYFTNPLLPSGVTIAEWSSTLSDGVVNTTFLPIVNREDRYFIYANFKTVPSQTAYLKIEYMDKFNQVIKNDIIRSSEFGEIVIPFQTEKYHIKLISSGCTEIYFENILFSKIKFEPFTVDQFWINPIKCNLETHKELFILFTEPEINTLYYLNREQLDKFSNILVISSAYNKHQLYLNHFLVEKLESILSEYKEKHSISSVTFVGYGPISNMAALFYKEKFSGTYALISNHFEQILYYQSMSEQLRTKITYPNFYHLYLSQFDQYLVFQYIPNREKTLLETAYLINFFNILNNISLSEYFIWRKGK